MSARYRKGSRVESLRWPGTHGSVVRVEGAYLGVRWDGTSFTEDEAHSDEVKPSTRPAPPDQGPGYAVVRDTRRRALMAPVTGLVVEVAAHEVGHGLVWRHGGFPIDHLRVRRGVFGGVSDAYCEHKRVTLTAASVQRYLIGLAGGAAGHALHLHRHAGYSRAAARSRAWPHARYDLGEFRRLARAWQTGLTPEAGFDRAWTVLTRHVEHADQLAARLAATGHLPGSAV